MVMTSRAKAVRIAKIADQKQAEDIRVLDLRPLSVFTDFFVIFQGNSSTHVEALREAVREQCKGLFHHGEIDRSKSWCLMDYGDVVVHIFLPETRQFYALERLWGDAPLVPYRKQAPRRHDDVRKRVVRTRRR